MFELSRTVRFATNFTAHLPNISGSEGVNGYSAAPALLGLGRYEEVVVRCVGPVDPVVNYLVDIKDVDRAVRRALAPKIAEAFALGARAPEPASILAGAFGEIDRELGGRVASVRWNLTPHQSVEVEMNTPGTAILRQKFELAASHRLHVESLSAEENRRLFGKCNHPSGHGHNYIFEPCVRVPVGAGSASGGTLSVGGLERAAKDTILDRFDHKYLNLDTPEFGPGGVVPSVENIAKVFFDLLAPAIAATGGGTLERITVWESERTAATYPA